jgi:UDP-2,3-diacylglucosamine pyrophosphatase LpxH
MNRRLEKNILVISDLHLGEGIGATTASVSYLRKLATLERELTAFLAHYTEHRLDGRPWRLVINGDMIDFMAVLILPQSGGTDDEKRWGLGYGERASVAKLESVLERHRGVFAQLARFVAAGNELVLVVGNHDVEFHFEEVKRRLLEALVRLGADPERVRFCPWFYYEAEIVYVEHGHQYDEYCSFDYLLHPVEPKHGVTLTVAHAGTRYFTNLVPTMNPHDAEAWGFLDFMRWARAQGARSVARVVLFYANLVRHIFAIWSMLTDRASDAERAELHRVRLREIAAEYRIAVEQVEALDGLRKLPVLKSLFKLLVALFLDRFLLGFATLVALAVVLPLAHGWWRLADAGAIIGAAVAANYALSRTRNLNSKALLRRVPEAIRRIVRAPFIVFGHSHHPEEIPLDEGATYFNTGTWDPDGSEHSFTHLIISGEEEPRAELCRWHDGASAPL